MNIKFNLTQKITNKPSFIIFSIEELYNGIAKEKLERYYDASWLVVSKCHYTGISDKHNICIYEGDIVKYLFINSKGQTQTIFGEVKYCNEDCRFMIFGIDNLKYKLNSKSIITVIGGSNNIYENPELLNVSQHEA